MENKYASLLPEALNFWYCRALDAEERERELRKENTELHERLNRENESANKHFMDSKKKDVEIAELQAALVNAGKELNVKSSTNGFWKNAASLLREELSRVEALNAENVKVLDKEIERANANKLLFNTWYRAYHELSGEVKKLEEASSTLQKKYDNAIAIGLGYMNQCEKAQSEVEGLKSTVKRMGEKITTLSDDLQLAKARLEYSNGLVDKMGKEKQYLIDQLTCDEKKIAGLQETVGRYAAECSKLNAELAAKRQAVPSPWIFTCNSFTA